MGRRRMWTFGSWQFRNWNATLILIWVGELLRRSLGAVAARIFYCSYWHVTIAVSPRNPNSPNVTPTSDFFPSWRHTCCCRFLSLPFPLIFNFVWLLSFLVERFVHFRRDVYIETSRCEAIFQADFNGKSLSLRVQWKAEFLALLAGSLCLIFILYLVGI